MASIKISELRPTGLELFQDTESFLNELTDNEVGVIEGGRRAISIGAINIQASIVANTVFTANGNTANANSIGGANTAVRSFR
jgi:hypothetical protein